MADKILTPEQYKAQVAASTLLSTELASPGRYSATEIQSATSLLRGKGLSSALIAAVAAQEAELSKDNVRLLTGEWVAKSSFGELASNDQQKLMDMGVSAFNTMKAAEALKAAEAFKADNTQLSTGEWVSKSVYSTLTGEQQDKLTKLGVQGFTDWQGQQVADFEFQHVKLDTGDYITKSDYDVLSPENQSKIKSMGVEAFNADQQTQIAVFEAEHVKVGTDEYITKIDFESLNPVMQTAVVAGGLEAISTTGLTAQQKLEKYKEWELVDSDVLYSGEKDGEPQYLAAESVKDLSPESRAYISDKGLDAFNEVVNNEVYIAGAGSYKEAVAAATERFNQQKALGLVSQDATLGIAWGNAGNPDSYSGYFDPADQAAYQGKTEAEMQSLLAGRDTVVITPVVPQLYFPQLYAPQAPASVAPTQPVASAGVMVTVPGVMGQMSEAVAKAVGYTNYTVVPAGNIGASGTGIPTGTAPPEPAAGTIDWYRYHGIQPIMGIPSKAQDIVDSANRVASEQGIVKPTIEQLAIIVGLPIEVYQQAELDVAAGLGASPQTAIQHIINTTGKVPDINPVEVVKAYGEVGAVKYLEAAGFGSESQALAQAGAVQLQAQKNIESAVGKNFSTIQLTSVDTIDKIVGGLGAEKAQSTLQDIGYKAVDAEQIVQDAQERLVKTEVVSKVSPKYGSFIDSEGRLDVSSLVKSLGKERADWQVVSSDLTTLGYDVSASNLQSAYNVAVALPSMYGISTSPTALSIGTVASMTPEEVEAKLKKIQDAYPKPGILGNIRMNIERGTEMLQYGAEKLAPYLPPLGTDWKPLLKTGATIVGMAPAMIPIGGTVLYWDTMPGWGKGLSIAGDALFVFPIAKGGMKLLGKAVVSEGVRAAETLASGVKATTTPKYIVDMAIKLGVSEEAATKLANLSRVQADYLVVRAKVAQVESNLAKLAESSPLRNITQQSLTVLSDQAAVLRTQIQTAGKEVAEIMTKGRGFTYSEIAQASDTEFANSLKNQLQAHVNAMGQIKAEIAAGTSWGKVITESPTAKTIAEIQSKVSAGIESAGKAIAETPEKVQVKLADVMAQVEQTGSELQKSLDKLASQVESKVSAESIDKLTAQTAAKAEKYQEAVQEAIAKVGSEAQQASGKAIEQALNKATSGLESVSKAMTEASTKVQAEVVDIMSQVEKAGQEWEAALSDLSTTIQSGASAETVNKIVAQAVKKSEAYKKTIQEAVDELGTAAKSKVEGQVQAQVAKLEKLNTTVDSQVSSIKARGDKLIQSIKASTSEEAITKRLADEAGKLQKSKEAIQDKLLEVEKAASESLKGTGLDIRAGGETIWTKGEKVLTEAEAKIGALGKEFSEQALKARLQKVLDTIDSYRTTLEQAIESGRFDTANLLVKIDEYLKEIGRLSQDLGIRLQKVGTKVKSGLQTIASEETRTKVISSLQNMQKDVDEALLRLKTRAKVKAVALQARVEGLPDEISRGFQATQEGVDKSLLRLKAEAKVKGVALQAGAEELTGKASEGLQSLWAKTQLLPTKAKDKVSSMKEALTREAYLKRQLAGLDDQGSELARQYRQELNDIEFYKVENIKERGIPKELWSERELKEFKETGIEPKFESVPYFEDEWTRKLYVEHYGEQLAGYTDDIFKNIIKPKQDIKALESQLSKARTELDTELVRYTSMSPEEKAALYSERKEIFGKLAKASDPSEISTLNARMIEVNSKIKLTPLEKSLRDLSSAERDYVAKVKGLQGEVASLEAKIAQEGATDLQRQSVDILRQIDDLHTERAAEEAKLAKQIEDLKRNRQYLRSQATIDRSAAKEVTLVKKLEELRSTPIEGEAELITQRQAIADKIQAGIKGTRVETTQWELGKMSELWQKQLAGKSYKEVMKEIEGGGVGTRTIPGKTLPGTGSSSKPWSLYKPQTGLLPSAMGMPLVGAGRWSEVIPGISPETTPIVRPETIPTLPETSPRTIPRTTPSIFPETTPSPDTIFPMPAPTIFPRTVPSTEPDVIPETTPLITEPEILPRVVPTTIPYTKPSTIPGTEPVTVPDTTPSTKPSIKDLFSAKPIPIYGISTISSLSTAPAIGTESVAITKQMQAIEPALRPAVETAPAIKTETETKIAIDTKVEVKAPPETKAPPEEKGSKRILPPPKQKKPEMVESRRVKTGTWTWRHGAYWEVLEPPYDKVVHMRNPPEGAYLFATGKGSAAKTLQIIPKGARPPRGETRADVGWAEAVITVDSSKPGGGSVKFIGHSKGRPRKGQTKAEKIARGEMVEEPKKRGRPKKIAEEPVPLESISEFPEDRIDRSQVREGELVNVESKPRSMRQEALAEYLPARVGTPAMKEVTLSDIEASIPAMRHFTPRSRKRYFTTEREPYARYYLGRLLPPPNVTPNLSGALK